MAFTAIELVELRRFAGYPALGVAGVPATVEAIAFEGALAGVSAEEEALIRSTYLPRLRAAEEAKVSAIATLDTKKAAVWERNPSALAEADAYLGGLRRDLMDLFGLPLGPFGYAGQPALPAIFVV
jgi:hypothetical protein